MDFSKPFLGFLCLFAFCNTSSNAFAPPANPTFRAALTPTTTVLIAWSTNSA